MARYLSLECGHYCAREIADLFAVFGDGTQYYCERCGEFKDVLRKTVRDVQPEEPLF
jgi:hypothetical protein